LVSRQTPCQLLRYPSALPTSDVVPRLVSVLPLPSHDSCLLYTPLAQVSLYRVNPISLRLNRRVFVLSFYFAPSNACMRALSNSFSDSSCSTLLLVSFITGNKCTHNLS